MKLFFSLMIFYFSHVWSVSHPILHNQTNFNIMIEAATCSQDPERGCQTHPFLIGPHSDMPITYPNVPFPYRWVLGFIHPISHQYLSCDNHNQIVFIIPAFDKSDSLICFSK